MGYFWGHFELFWVPNELFLGSGYSSRTVFGSPHIVKQLLFSIVPSILTLDFDLILGVISRFLGALVGHFWGQGRVQKLIWGLLFSLFFFNCKF